MSEYHTAADHAWSLAYSADQAFNDLRMTEADETRLRSVDDCNIPDVTVPTATYDELANQRSQAAYEFETMVSMIPPPDQEPFVIRDSESSSYNAERTKQMGSSTLRASELVKLEIPHTAALSNDPTTHAVSLIRSAQQFTKDYFNAQ